MFATLLPRGETLDYRFDANRQGHLHLARGQLRMRHVALQQGDGIRVQKHEVLEVEDAEVLLVELP